jgi:hypothetical protein
MKKDKKEKNKGQNKAMDAVRAYTDRPDPLGSYSGVTPEMRCMPRKRIDGKVFMKLEDTRPVQDADDL